MTVTPAQTLAHLRRAREEAQRAGLERARRLRERLPEAARLLRDEYGVRRVVLFGSLAVGEPHAGSDVDLAARGLAPERLFDAMARLMDLFGCPVDLVCLERAPASLKERVDAEGEEL